MNTKIFGPFIAGRQAISRRCFLRGAGMAMSLAAMCASYVEHMETHLGQIEA